MVDTPASGYAAATPPGVHTVIEAPPPKQRPAAKADTRYAVPALDKALDVLELLSDLRQPVNQAEIARALGRNASEIFRTLNALETRGYVRRTDGGRYRLSLKLFELSRAHSPYEEILRVALPAMQRLVARISESCHLSMLRDGEVLVLSQVDSPVPIRLSIEVGSRHPVLTTTSGRVLLAAMANDERDDFLRRHTDFANRSTDAQDVFITQLHAIRERGYAIAEGERFVGGLDVGVLVGSPGSTVRAALVVSALRSADRPDVQALIEGVRAAANAITQDSGIAEPAGH